MNEEYLLNIYIEDEPIILRENIEFRTGISKTVGFKLFCVQYKFDQLKKSIINFLLRK